MSPYRPRPHHAAIAAAIIILLLAALFWPRKSAKHQELSPPPALTAPSATPSSAPRPTAATPPRTSASTWNSFQQRFGSQLQVQWGPDHHAAAIKGKFGKGTRASSEFSPTNEQQVRARAREIIDSARELLGINPDHPLNSGIYRGDDVSAHLYYRETIAGLPVEPHGAVTIDLGPQGQLTGLYSEYLPNLRVANSISVDAPTARAKALAAVTDPSAPLRATGGEQVIWVTHGEGRHAYIFSVNGRQVVVDAANGKVLYTHDQRVN